MDFCTLQPVTVIEPALAESATPPVEVTFTAPAAAVVPPTTMLSVVLLVEVTATSLPPLTVTAPPAEVAATSVVAAAVRAWVLLLPTLREVRPEKEVVFRATALPLVTLIFSMPDTVAPTGAEPIAAAVTMFRVSVPAPPFRESPVVHTAPAATSAAVKVSLPAVPVKLSAPAVSEPV